MMTGGAVVDTVVGGVDPMTRSVDSDDVPTRNYDDQTTVGNLSCAEMLL